MIGSVSTPSLDDRRPQLADHPLLPLDQLELVAQLLLAALARGDVERDADQRRVGRQVRRHRHHPVLHRHPGLLGRVVDALPRERRAQPEGALVVPVDLDHVVADQRPRAHAERRQPAALVEQRVPGAVDRPDDDVELVEDRPQRDPLDRRARRLRRGAAVAEHADRASVGVGERLRRPLEVVAEHLPRPRLAAGQQRAPGRLAAGDRQQLGDRPAEGGRSRRREGLLGARVPVGDPQRLVEADEHERRPGQQPLRPRRRRGPGSRAHVGHADIVGDFLREDVIRRAGASAPD
jgi:hypothetical protein